MEWKELRRGGSVALFERENLISIRLNGRLHGHRRFTA